MADSKPSFLGSLFAGIGGYVKGALAGITIGGVAGAAIGALVGLATGGVGAVGAAALVGGTYTAAVLGTIGATAGTMTGVVNHRARHNISEEDVVKVAKVSFAQGVAVGHNIEMEAGRASETETTKWRDKYAKEQAARAMAAGSPSQSIH